MTDSTPYGTAPDEPGGTPAAPEPGAAAPPPDPGAAVPLPPPGTWSTGDGATEALETGVLADQPAARSRKGLVIGAGAAVLAVGAAAGIYVATQLAGGGLQPSGIAPMSTFAFAQIDLDPAASQKLAVRDFAGKFPSAPKAAAEDIFEALVAEALKGDEAEIDYQRDVKPWLGKRVGIAGFTPSGNAPEVAGILQVEDEAKARESLQRLAAEAKKDGEEFAFAIDRGYAVIADNQTLADRVLADSARESLDDNAQFTKDVGELTGDQVLTGWVDVKRAFDIAKAASRDLRLLPSFVTDQFSGRLVVGAHAASEYVEVEGFELGSSFVKGATTAEPSLLTNLPASTVAAISVNGAAAQLDKTYDSLAGTMFDPEQFLGDFEAQTGISIRQDLLPLFGKRMVVALGNIAFDPQQIMAGLVSEVADPVKAKAAGLKLLQLGAAIGVPLNADVAGNLFYFTAGEGYLAKLKNDKGLGGSPTFRAAMGELGNSVAAAVYVDLSAIISTTGADDPNLRALRAFGASSGVKDGKGYFRLRLVAR